MGEQATWGEKLDAAIVEAAKENQRAKKVIRSEELVWEEDKMARSALLISAHTGFNLKSIHSSSPKCLPAQVRASIVTPARP